MISNDRLLVLDTCVVLAYLRRKTLGEYIEKTFHLRNRGQVPIISIVTHAELLSIVRRSKSPWGPEKLSYLGELMREFVPVDIDTQEIIEKYAEIDSYALSLPSSKKMGKNDLWIAATAAIAEACLLTTDRDFLAIGCEFHDLVWINPENPDSTTTQIFEAPH